MTTSDDAAREAVKVECSVVMFFEWGGVGIEQSCRRVASKDAHMKIDFFPNFVLCIQENHV
jgi:hypothetical protein